VVDPCPLAHDLDPLWERLSVELAAEGVAWVDASPAIDTVVVSLALSKCEPRPLAMTVSASRQGAGSRSRVVSLRDAISPLGARTAALVTTEFVRAALLDLRSSTPAPAGEAALSSAREEAATVVEPGAPAKPLEPITIAGQDARDAPEPTTSPGGGSVDAPPPPLRPRLAGELVQRVYPSRTTSLLGARFSGSYPLATRAELRMSASSLWGSNEDAIGSAAIWCAAATVGLVVALPAAPLQLQIGPELEVGYARATGRPNDASVQTRSAGGVVVMAGVHARIAGSLGGAWQWFVAAQAGQTLLGLAWKADARRMSGLEGVTFATGLGAELLL